MPRSLSVRPLPLARLADFVRGHRVTPQQLAALDPAPGERCWTRLDPAPPAGLAGSDWAVWLIAWAPGSSTGWHDHGPSAGAFAVLSGTLTERYARRAARTGPALDLALPPGGPRSRALRTGQVRPFGPEHVHDVLNTGSANAYSLHAYARDLPLMRRYRLDGGRLLHTATEVSGRDW
ncbi:cysteine dioxygenase [Phaeacidiphilus oryzae]|uniref:cysteine dioxygenase n=1 Tax=Phaeacidiphilus oryzae TaxID=348818 RepID=UPI00068EDBBE|nr:cysteine dioxygenase family protein [Phaeacidiphilus oryzae]